MSKRITTRFNDLEEIELEKLKATFQLEDDSKAIKLCIEWVNNHLKNVTSLFFPPSYDVVLYKKLKTFKRNKKVIGEND